MDVKPTAEQVEVEARAIADELGAWPPTPEEHEELRDLAREQLLAKREKQVHATIVAAIAARALMNIPTKQRLVIEALQADPTQTEDAIHAKLGVSANTIWEAKKKLEVINGHPLSPRLGGQKIHIADGSAPTVGVARALQLHPNNQVKAAASIGIHKDTYGLIRKLLLLREGYRITKDDREIVDRLLLQIDKDKQISHETRREVHRLLAQNQIKLPKDRGDRKRKRFDATVMNIRESCASTVEMAIPDLDKTAVIAAMVSLSTSVEQVMRLMRRIIGEKEET